MNPLAELDKLLRMFDGGQSLLADVRHVPAALLPEPYRRLLAHDQHMTVTMEAYHGSPVRVEVLNRSRSGDCCTVVRSCCDWTRTGDCRKGRSSSMAWSGSTCSM